MYCAAITPTSSAALLEYRSELKPLPIGLALSGGTAKSVLHVGVIRALREAQLPISCIAGTSGGSIVAAITASGADTAHMEEIAAGLSWRKLARIKLSRLGFVSSSPIEQFIEKVLPGVHFEHLQIPCAVTATDLMSGKAAAFTRGPVARAIRASCSIPQIYLPVQIDGRPYVDGGLAQYLPVETVRQLGGQFTIAVHLGPACEAYQPPENLLQLIMQVTNMVAKQNTKDSMARADVVIHPNVDDYSSFDFRNTTELIDLGYETARAQVPRIEQAWRRANRPWRRLLIRNR